MTLPSMLLAVLAGAALSGCGNAQSQQSELDEALRTVQLAEVGYVPNQAGNTASVAAYRQQTLGKAAQQLDLVIQNGTPGEKVAARRLKADIQASAARDAAREAAAEYEQLAPRAVELVTYAVAAERAAARGAAMDERQPAVIAGLNEEIGKQNQRKSELQREAADLQKKLDAENAALAEINTRRDQAVGQAQQLRDQAFVQEGQQQFDTYEQAAVAEREGTKADAEVARRQLNIDVLNSQLSVLKSQLALTDNLLTELSERVKAGQARQTEIETGVAGANTDRDAQLAKLRTEVDQLVSVYRSAVEQRLATATEQMRSAVSLLEQAQGDARLATNREAVQLDLLAARAAEAHLLAQQLLVTSGFHSILGVIAQNTQKLEGAELPALQQAMADLAQKKTQLATQAREAVQRGQELAQQLAGGSGAVAEAAQKRTERFEAYKQSIDAAVQSPAPEAPAPAPQQ